MSPLSISRIEKSGGRSIESPNGQVIISSDCDPYQDLASSVCLGKYAQAIHRINVTKNLVVVEFVPRDIYSLMLLRRPDSKKPIICELKSMVFDDPTLSLDVRIDRDLNIRLRYIP